MNNVLGFSHQFAAAEQAQIDAKSALAEAQSEVSSLRERIVGMQAERSGIITRRARGHQEKNDGARLALLEADMEGLSAIVAEAEGRVAMKQRAEAEAAKNLIIANEHLAFERSRITQDALVAHADRLGKLLLASLEALETAQRGPFPPSSTYAPSDALWMRLRKIQAMRNRL